MSEQEGNIYNNFAHEPGISREEMVLRYAKWAADGRYEKDLNETVYHGPAYAADFVARHFPEEADRKSAKILDVAAGSGLVAEKLKRKGFDNIDALEPCSDLLQLALKKGVYTRTFEIYLDENPSEIESDYYDVAVTSGGMGQSHIPCKGLDELIRVVKPGGILVIAMREQYLSTVPEYKDRLEPMMAELEAQGKFSKVLREVVPRYSFDNTGVVFVFRVHENSTGLSSSSDI